MARITICAVPDCGKKKHAHIFCNSHYLRHKKYGDPLAGGKFRTPGGNECFVDGCDNMSVSQNYCPKHLARYKKYGDPTAYHPDTNKVQKWIDAHKDYNGEECLKWPFSVGDQGRGTIGGRGRSMSAPRYMCIAAHGKPLNEEHQAAHSCGKGHEGCMNPKHLRWATRSENEEDKRIHGTLRKGSDINTSKLTDSDVINIRRRLLNEKPPALAREYGVSRATIYVIRDRKSWRWLE